MVSINHNARDPKCKPILNKEIVTEYDTVILVKDIEFVNIMCGGFNENVGGEGWENQWKVRVKLWGEDYSEHSPVIKRGTLKECSDFVASISCNIGGKS